MWIEFQEDAPDCLPVGLFWIALEKGGEFLRIRFRRRPVGRCRRCHDNDATRGTCPVSNTDALEQGVSLALVRTRSFLARNGFQVLFVHIKVENSLMQSIPKTIGLVSSRTASVLLFVVSSKWQTLLIRYGLRSCSSCQTSFLRNSELCALSRFHFKDFLNDDRDGL